MATGNITLLIPVLAGLVVLFGAAVFLVRRYGRTGVHE
jgi:LPXTG-motif cell wall-anchored protein